MIEQARLWGAGRVRRQSLLSLLLLLILFASLVHGVSDSVRGIERGLLWPVVLTGLPLGWLLAYREVRGWLAALIALLGGVVPLFLHVGQLGGSLAALFVESIQVLWQAIQAGSWPGAAPVQAAWAELTEGFSVLVIRLGTWLLNLVQGQPAFDPLPIALLWGLALWATATWAGWAVRRRIDTVWAAVPAIGLLAITLSFVGGRAWYLLPMLASMLVLRVLAEYDARRQRWEQDGVRYAPRIRSSTFWLALGLSLALMVAAALTPSISVAGVVELARNLTDVQPADGEVASFLGLEGQPASVPAELTMLDARRSSGLPNRHLIGAGPELSEQLVMVVSIESAPPVAGQPEAHLYWRSLTYERYTGHGWSAEYAGKVTYAPGEATVATSSAHQRRLRASVRRVRDTTELLYRAGNLLTADGEFRVAWRALPEEEESGDMYGALIEADSYRVDSLVPAAGEVDLRAAGQDYPAWIVERYLPLPESVPSRVLALARDLTARELTPYDRALAIERYLRSFPYTLDLPSPPTDQDLVDYFLFDLKKGYCDYYATAMVVLARAAGVPARLVTGYASGSYHEARQQYVVTEAAAHAWAEIYFPGYGWIEFEPTASLPAIERPTELLPDSQMELDAPPEPITARHRRVALGRWLGIGGGLLAMAVIGALVWSMADAWRVRHLPPNVAIIDLYQRLYRYAPRLGASPRPGATPREFAADLGSRLRHLADRRHSAAWLDAAPREIRQLSELCTGALYSPHRTRRMEQRQAFQIWRRLRRRLCIARLVSLAPRRSLGTGKDFHLRTVEN